MDQFLKIISDYMSRPEAIAAIGALTIFFFIVLAVLWIILPFAVFGTKKRLDAIISESQKVNSWMEELLSENQKMNYWLSEIMSESTSADDYPS